MRISQSAAILLFTLVLASPAIAQHSGHDSTHGNRQISQDMQHGAMKSSPNATKAEFDHQFIDTMIVHHQSAIEMAQLAEERAAHDELKQMAKKMSADQKREIEQLQNWKQEWYPDKGDALNMRMPGMAESMKDMPMDKLEAAKGEEFDRQFIDMMMRHHRGAIEMAQTAQKKAKHPEIKKIAQEIIREQKKENAQMTKWKKDWKLSQK